MANTTHNKKNTASRSKGSSNRSRSKKSSSSGATWVAGSIIFAALCGTGCYLYEKWDTSEEVVATSHEDTGAQPQQETLQEETKEKPVALHPATKQETEKKAAVQQSPETATKPKQQKGTSKFAAPSYKKYHQGRWDYTVVYPSFLTQKIQSENSDGCHFADYEGTEFITYGSWNIEEATIRDLFRAKLDDNLKVTYKRLYKEENYFIKFGYTKDGRMFYMKQVIADKLEGAPVITGILYFRPEFKEGSEAVIKKMFDKFPY